MQSSNSTKETVQNKNMTGKTMDVPTSLVKKFESELKEFNSNLTKIMQVYNTSKCVNKLPFTFKIFTKYKNDVLMDSALDEFILLKMEEHISVRYKLMIREWDFNYDINRIIYDANYDTNYDAIYYDDNNDKNYWYEVECVKLKKKHNNCCCQCGCLVNEDNC